MKNLIRLWCLLFPVCGIAQFQFNDFEFNNNFDIHIGSNAEDSIWQVGVPQKVLFNSANSLPNALVTDTLNTYPTNQNASFEVVIEGDGLLGYPFTQLEWMQKTDLEDGVDGGIIEASYDEGMTWLNVFNDTTFRPAVVGGHFWDTLYNDQAGMTGTQDWTWTAICWGTYWGTLPQNISSVRLRFTLASDAVDTAQEGWMIDNFYVRGEVIGNTSNQIETESISIFPNPVNDAFFIALDEVGGDQAVLEVLDVNGKIIQQTIFDPSAFETYRVSMAGYVGGWYSILIRTEESIFQQKFIKI